MTEHPDIQIVDEHDKPLRGASMIEAYAQGLIHRIVFVIVEDTNGQILLQKRGPHVINYPNCWDISAGGHVDEGETYEYAAMRELKEEMGLQIDLLQLLDSYYHEAEVRGYLLKRFNRVYKVVVEPDIMIKPDPAEVIAIKWMTLTDVNKLIASHPEQIASGLSESIKSYENFRHQAAA